MVDFETAEAMGISRQAFDEILDIVGRQPTIDELSTLLAMWESNGKQQSLYGWLRGQHHVVERNDYLYSGQADHKSIREPRVKECVELAKELSGSQRWVACGQPPLATGQLLYMVGNVSEEFAGSEYARRCLHLVEAPMATGGHEEDCQYIELILGALQEGALVLSSAPVGQGGLFCSLLRFVNPSQAIKQSHTQAIKPSPTQAIKQSCNQAIGFDILVPREVRLDAFLFGEEPGRYLVALEERQDDAFLLKMDDARLNCCFLGRTTKNRVVVDGYDFGPTTSYLSAN